MGNSEAPSYHSVACTQPKVSSRCSRNSPDGSSTKRLFIAMLFAPQRDSTRVHSMRNVSTSLRQWLGEFYVAFEPASSSSVSWLLGDGCSVVAARWWLLRDRCALAGSPFRSPKILNLQRRVHSRVRAVELVNCAAIQASASERQIHRQVTRSARAPVTWLLGGGCSVVVARWWLLGGGCSVVVARWWLLGGGCRGPDVG
jgi:hypothetical protein